MKKYTCYRVKDSEGDIWCEQAFLFEKDSDVKKFFTKQKIADLFYGGELRLVKSFKFIGNYIEINGGGLDGIEIVEMAGGYFINAL